jgi:hypothetical protein
LDDFGFGFDATTTTTPHHKEGEKQEAANDSTLNMAYANGTPDPSITPDATSNNTTAGVAPTLSYLLNLYDVSARVTSSYMGATVRLSVNLTGRITAP